jgi:hypothetical protein
MIWNKNSYIPLFCYFVNLLQTSLTIFSSYSKPQMLILNLKSLKICSPWRALILLLFQSDFLLVYKHHYNITEIKFSRKFKVSSYFFSHHPNTISEFYLCICIYSAFFMATALAFKRLFQTIIQLNNAIQHSHSWLINTQLVMKFSAFYENWRSINYHAHKSMQLKPYPEPDELSLYLHRVFL